MPACGMRETNTYAPVAELLAMPRIGELSYAGGVGLPDGRVVFCPRKARDLVVWDPGLGVAFGRDIALAGSGITSREGPRG